MKESTNIITADEENSGGIKFVRWITRNGERVYPPNGKKAWPLHGRKKKVS